MNRITKTMVISLLLIIFMPTAKLSAQVSTWDGTWEPWTHGTGTEADPFLIENAQQLAYLAYRVNNGLDAGGGHVSNHDYHYKLMVDIDLNGSEDFQWTPIGYWNSSTNYQFFGGHFNGNEHVVLRLYIHNNANRIGFFGATDGANVANFGITDGSLSTMGQYAGGIIGWVENGCTITNCYNKGNITTSGNNNSYSGGILGYVNSGNIIITNSYNTGNVTTSGNNSYYHGGILGYANSCNLTITNCYNSGNVMTSGQRNCCGGILGYTYYASTTITNCYNTGNVTTYGGYNYTGGIIGYPNYAFISVASCYNVGSLMPSGGNHCGGIMGCISGDNYNTMNCYYLSTCGGDNTYGGQPMSSNAMQLNEFVELLNNGTCSWNPDNTSMNNGYPVLSMLSYSAETYHATGITATSAILHGSVSTTNTEVVLKGFEYRKIGEIAFSNISITNDLDYFSYNLSGLTTNTTYEYRTFLNVSDCNTTTYGDIKTFELSLLNNDTVYIYDADMLRWVSEQCNSGTTFEGKCIKLMNDITLPFDVPNNMTSIGIYPNYPFKGTFDGNGKLITNLYIDQPNTPYQGFFGYTLNANLYNVGLVNITASGRNYTGGMVAYAANTHMRECYVNGGRLNALSYCGGLVGYQEQGTNSIISGCYNTCEVTGTNYVGGLIGFSNYSTVRNSYVAGRVVAQGEPVGAIIGGANEVLMYYCYFSTEITGQTNAIGWNNIGKDGGEGMTNAQMRDPQFVATLNQGLVTPVWMTDYATPINNGFPIIKWQRPGTSVEENNVTKNYISLYPNPAKDFVTIQSDDLSVSLQSMEVYDVTGRKVMSEISDGQSQEFSIAKLLPGVYHVRVQTDNGYCTNLKLVVQ